VQQELALGLERVRVRALGLALAQELVRALGPGQVLEPGQVPHNQPPNLRLVIVPTESTIFSFSPIYLLQKFCNPAVQEYFLLKTITSLIVYLGILP